MFLVTKINILKYNKLCAAFWFTISERMDREENTTWISMTLLLKHTLILCSFCTPVWTSQIHFIFLDKLLSFSLNLLYIWYNIRNFVFLIKRLHKVSCQNTWYQDIHSHKCSVRILKWALKQLSIKKNPNTIKVSLLTQYRYLVSNQVTSFHLPSSQLPS